jgi:hypothetical protein
VSTWTGRSSCQSRDSSCCHVGGYSRADVFLAGTEQEDEPMDYERLTATSESFIYVAMTRVMVRRLARAQ